MTNAEKIREYAERFDHPGRELTAGVYRLARGLLAALVVLEPNLQEDEHVCPDALLGTIAKAMGLEVDSDKR